MVERQPDERIGPPRQVLSRDEIRELLSPLRSESPDDRPPVLVLTDRPEDAESIAKTLKRVDISHVAASHRFAALDWFRQRPYSAVVASTRSLLIEAQGFVERLREVDPNIPVYLICDPDEDPLIQGVELIRRPLTEQCLREFARGVAPESTTPSSPERHPGSQDGPPLEPVPLQPPGDAAGSAPVPRPTSIVRDSDPVRRPISTVRHLDPDGESPLRYDESRGERTEDLTEAGRGLPDPFAAIQCLTEARLAGGDLEAGLRRWIHEDENVSGMAVLTLETPADLEAAGTVGLGSSGYTCRAIATSLEVREQILRSAAAQLGESLFESDDSLAVRSEFLVFGEPGRPRSRWAIFAPRLAEAPEGAERIAAGVGRCLDQLRRVRREAVAPEGPERSSLERSAELAGDRGERGPQSSTFGGAVGAQLRSIHDRLTDIEQDLRQRTSDRDS